MCVLKGFKNPSTFESLTLYKGKSEDLFHFWWPRFLSAIINYKQDEMKQAEYIIISHYSTKPLIDVIEHQLAVTQVDWAFKFQNAIWLIFGHFLKVYSNCTCTHEFYKKIACWSISCTYMYMVHATWYNTEIFSIKNHFIWFILNALL